jgi:hypothetical protein
MSPLTIFLAKLLGLFCLLFALAMAANRQNTLAAIDEILRSPALTMMSSLLALATGLAMVLAHNRWSGGALPVVVTFIGWASLSKGALLLLFSSEQSLKFYQATGYRRHFLLYMAAMSLIGVYLTLAGFAA